MIGCVSLSDTRATRWVAEVATLGLYAAKIDQVDTMVAPPECLAPPASMSAEAYFAALTVVQVGTETAATQCLTAASEWLLAEREARSGELPGELAELELYAGLIEAAKVAADAAIAASGHGDP